MKAKKIRNIHILRRNGSWAAVWQFGHGKVVRHADTPEHALIVLLSCELPPQSDRRFISSHMGFVSWLERNGLIDLRRRLLYTKRHGLLDVATLEAVRVYRKWRREQTSGTSLGLEE